jgi:hypothetical protein
MRPDYPATRKQSNQTKVQLRTYPTYILLFRKWFASSSRTKHLVPTADCVPGVLRWFPCYGLVC